MFHKIKLLCFLVLYELDVLVGMLGTVWACLGESRRILACLGCSALLRRIWTCLGMFRRVWPY